MHRKCMMNPMADEKERKEGGKEGKDGRKERNSILKTTDFSIV